MADAIPSDVGATLSDRERRILAVLAQSSHASLEDVQRLGEFATADEAFGAASWLQSKGLVTIDERTTNLYGLGDEGREYAKTGLPEERLRSYLLAHGGRLGLSALRTQAGLTEEQLQIALTWWKRKGLGELSKEGAETVLIAASKWAPGKDAAALKTLAAREWVPESHADAEGLRLLKSRRGVVRQSTHRERELRLTPRGLDVAHALAAAPSTIGALTPDLIQSGAWRGKSLRPYDVATPAPRLSAAKPHPMVQLIEEIRSIFVELGFQEIDEEYVVPVLWNMDALFIPQDHLARDMQDTFYLENPASLPVEKEVVAKLRKVHQTGAGTGSRGWGGGFDERESERALLRTHTTVGTIRHLAQHPSETLRVFSIGRVFRKETMDATHLPEFHQIEGICTEPKADFRMLLGILKEFYKRVGFEKLRWRPSYYPYTEPSMDVEVWNGKKWMELGGCGIFRPEVTLPFGVKTPVLAWGLGLERLAMMRFGLSDIRQLYVSDLEWLRNQALV